MDHKHTHTHMQGATDGGKHIEAMRTEHMKSGFCRLKATGCQGFCKVLEKHHESYKPERTIYLCHHCHHLVHFRPYQLTDQQKGKLLCLRHGPSLWLAFSKKPRVAEMMRKNYVAPGRRKAQLEIRRRVRERAHRM